MLQRAQAVARRAATRLRERASLADDDDGCRLDGKIAVVCGGTGEVGEGIVAALLIAGATVAVPSRSGERLAELADRLETAGVPTERLAPLVGDLTEMPDGAHEIAAELSRLTGRPDLVVVALGSWTQADALADLEIDEWDAVIAGSLRAHQLAAAAFLPLMRGRAGAMYVQINGAAARYPVPGSGPVSVASAGQLMAAQVMAAEEAGHGIQVETLVLGPVATRSRTDAAPWMISARALGDLVVDRAARRAAHGDEVRARAEASGLLLEPPMQTEPTGADDDLPRDARPAPTRIHPDALTPGGPATVLELLTVADLGAARRAAPGALRGARGGAFGWVLWGLQNGALSRQVRRSRTPSGD